MKKMIEQVAVRRLAGFLLLATMAITAGCKKNNLPKTFTDFTQVNLVANNGGYGAAHIDPTLMNAWGLAFSATGTPWVNATGGHVSKVYDKDGAPIAARPAVNIPSPGGATGGSPTGIVFNSSTTDFKLTNGQPARFIFVGVDGILSAWNSGNNAQLIKNNVGVAVYTGLALASKSGANYLYAADFKGGKIDVWDNSFSPVSIKFQDDHIPAGYAPFNIQAIGSFLYVMYAKVGPDGRDQAGYGNGYVDVFRTDGSLEKRLIARGSLNSPWGVAQAPASFFNDMNNHDNGDDHGHDGKGGDNSGKGNSGNGNSGSPDDDNIILVGNFGDGHINAYRDNGDFIGQVKSGGLPVVIPGLWALSFPPVTATTVDPNRLYFTAGPAGEKDGLFGYLIKK